MSVSSDDGWDSHPPTPTPSVYVSFIVGSRDSGGQLKKWRRGEKGAGNGETRAPVCFVGSGLVFSLSLTASLQLRVFGVR
jgi:hypothetical protein